MDCRPLEIYFRDITPEQKQRVEPLIVRAAQGEPIQYIIGRVDFRDLEIHCDARALIPRPETELLVDAALRAVSGVRSSASDALRIADVCTGTGCIGLSLAFEVPGAMVTGIDISPEALSLARENAERLGLSGRFQLLENNLLAGFEDASFDLVVSNPPYILADVCKELDPSVRDYEPMLALDGGGDGLDLIRPLVEQAARVLRPGGGLLLEIGYDQGDAVSDCLKKAGFQNVAVTQDYAGLDRIVSGAI